MRHLTTIKYQPNDNEADFKLILFCTILIVGGILMLFLRDWYYLSVYLVSLFLTFTWLRQTRGYFEVFQKGKRLYISQYENGEQLLDKRLVLSHQFSWNYSFVKTLTDRHEGQNHNTFYLLKWELELSRREYLRIGMELNPWQDLPADWNYLLLEEEEEKELLVTSSNLKKWKKQVEELY